MYILRHFWTLNILLLQDDAMPSRLLYAPPPARPELRRLALCGSDCASSHRSGEGGGHGDPSVWLCIRLQPARTRACAPCPLHDAYSVLRCMLGIPNPVTSMKGGNCGGDRGGARECRVGVPPPPSHFKIKMHVGRSHNTQLAYKATPVISVVCSLNISDDNVQRWKVPVLQRVMVNTT